MRDIDLAWPILIFILGFFCYAAYAIKNEKEWAKKNEAVFQLKELFFNTPAWWSVFKQEQHSIQFHRSDTKYDWKATCEFLSTKQADLEKFVIQKLNQENILFDIEATDITQNTNSLRIEGSATKNNEKRLYLDVYLLRNDSSGLYYFENRSSILNGCVEGPYFEELIKSIRFI